MYSRGSVCRNVSEAPFAATSIWNTPVGSEARFVNAHIFDTALGFAHPESFHNDHEFLIHTSTRDPYVSWYDQPSSNDAAPGAYRCAILNTSITSASLRMPHNFTTGSSPNNNGAAIIQPDRRTYIEMQPLYRCTAGGPIAAAYGGEAQPTPHLNDLYGDGTLGAHGGSGLSALGGQIRLRELNPASGPIAHALKLELLAHVYYSPLRRHITAAGIYGSFRWPAIGSDGYTFHPPARYPDLLYNGSIEAMVPGSLLAIPSTLAAARRASLTTEFGERVFDALTHFGGYLVDDTANSLGALCMQAGAGAVLAERYGPLFNMTFPTGVAAGSPLYADLVVAFQALHVVDNNVPSAVGGGGAPIVAPPPDRKSVV